MAGRIKNECIDRVRDATDIATLIGSYISLKRSGRGFVGLCPFHDEKTPSFNVSAERGRYKCFGCNASGNVFDFVMNMDKVEFVEAVEILAARASIVVEREEGRESQSEERGWSKQDLYRVNDWAARVFRRSFVSEEGAACRDYVLGRKIDAAMVERYRLGFAASSRDWLCRRAMRQSIAPDLLVAAGLAKLRDDGTYVDMFRQRLMFPIGDTLGRVIGFGGRSMDGSEPKYLNSPETPVFLKRRSFYGVEGMKVAAKDDAIFIMEGYTDVIMAAQHGCHSAMATLGTSLGEEHAKALARFARPVILVYDGDAAGRRAAERGAGVFASVDLDLKVCLLDGNEDPCDFYLRAGSSATTWIRDHAVDFLEFVIREVKGRHDLSSVSGRARAADELLKLTSLMVNPVTKSLTIDRISRALDLRAEDLISRMKATASPGRIAPRPAAVPQEDVDVEPPIPLSQRTAERTVLRWAMLNGIRDAMLDSIRTSDFMQPLGRALWERLGIAAKAGWTPGDVEMLLRDVDDRPTRDFINQLVPNEAELPLSEERLVDDLRYFDRRRREEERRQAKLRARNDDELLRTLTTSRRTAPPEESPPPDSEADRFEIVDTDDETF